VAGEIFPTPKLGLRLGYSAWDGEFAPDVDSYDLSATWFATHKVGIALTFSQQRVRGAFFDRLESDATALRIVGRF
jgi:hypothetical protein